MKKDGIEKHYITTFYTLDLGVFAKTEFQMFSSRLGIFLPFLELKKYACNNPCKVSYRPAKFDDQRYSGSKEIVFLLCHVIQM